MNNLDGIIVSGISQRRKHKSCMNSLICEAQRAQIHRNNIEEQSTGLHGWRGNENGDAAQMVQSYNYMIRINLEM